MRARLADEVRALAGTIAEERIRTEIPGVTAQARKIVEDHIRALPDAEKLTAAAFTKGLGNHSGELRRVIRSEAEKIAENKVRLLPDAKKVEEMLRRSPEVKAVARREATVAAAAETRRLVDGEYRSTVDTMVEKVVRESVVDVVRTHAHRVIGEGALPRRLEVVVGGRSAVAVDGDTHKVLPDLVLALAAGCHVLLVGPAGTGKSTMAKQAAQALDLGFHAMSVGPTTPTSKMFGYLDAHGTYHRTPLREAYECGGLMLLDELDNGHPGLLAELNQALSLNVCAFPDGMIERHDRFRLVATANTYGHGGSREYVGRQALDAATLDRLVIVNVPVDEEMERRVTLAAAPTAARQAGTFLDEVRRLRRAAEEKKLPVIFSPRASLHAARLLESGAEPAKVWQWCLVRGLSEAHRTALGMKDTA